MAFFTYPYNTEIVMGSWRLQPRPDVRATDFQAGPHNERRRFDRMIYEVAFSIIMLNEVFDQFRDWVVENTNAGADKFLMTIWDGEEYLECTVQFSRPYNATYFSLAYTSVGFQLIIYDLPVLGDDAIWMLGQYNPDDFISWSNQLHELVHVEYPDAVLIFDAATTAWKNQVVTNGGTVSGARKQIVDNFIVGLKADGIWTKFDRLWLLAAENQISARTDLAGLTLATNQGNTFTTDRGYLGVDANPATAWVDTNFNPRTQGVQYTQNDAHLSAWQIGTVFATSSSGGFLVGANDGSSQAHLITPSSVGPIGSDGGFYMRLNDSPATGVNVVLGNYNGHFLGNRTGAALDKSYKNGVNVATPNQTTGLRPNLTFFINAIDASGTPIGGNPNICAAASMGASLTDAQITQFYNRLRTYMTAVGVP